MALSIWKQPKKQCKKIKMGKAYALILNYNSAEETVALYNNLKNSEYKDLEILVIDNDSKPVDKEKLQEHILKPNLIFNSQNLGYAGGNNVGIKKAIDGEADYIWILNPDIRIEPNTLNILIDLLERDASLAAVGPKIISRENNNMIFTDGELIDLTNGLHTFHKNHNKPVLSTEEKVDYEIDYIDGSSVLLRTAAVKELGFLPEEYFLYWEETDWCTNAKRNNWNLAIDTNAVVYNLNSEKGAIYHYYYNRNKLLFSKKFNLNYNLVVKREKTKLYKEVRNRFSGKYLKPFFISRLKGVLAGILLNTRR